jgi:hypothetical protein
LKRLNLQQGELEKSGCGSLSFLKPFRESSSTPAPYADAQRAWTLERSAYSKQKVQKDFPIPKTPFRGSSHARMKKLLLIGAILVGAVTASQAGVSVSFRIGVPLPPPPFVIRHSVPVYAPPVVLPQPFCPPPRVILPCPPPPRYHYRYRYDSRGYGPAHYRHHSYNRQGHGRRH